MNPAVEKFVKPVIDKTTELVGNTVSGTRGAVNSSADFLARGQRPVEVLARSGLKLNKISHDSIAKLLSAQADMVEGTLVATAKRLETAANAGSFRQLVDDQVALIPATRQRLTDDAMKALNVLVKTRDELRQLITETAGEFGKTASKTADSAARTVKRARKSATTATRKTTAGAKKAARKTSKKVRKTTAKAKKKVTRRAR